MKVVFFRGIWAVYVEKDLNSLELFYVENFDLKNQKLGGSI